MATMPDCMTLTPMNSSFFFLYCLVFVTPILLLFRYASRSSYLDKLPMPPGPTPWPILGNIFHFGPKPHLSLAQFAQTHGPLISLKLGSRTLVVGSSPEVAAEILKTHDRILSGRYVPDAVPYKETGLHGFSLVWADECTETWRSLKALCRTQMFSTKAIETQSHLREKTTFEMVEYLEAMEGKVVHIGDIVFTTVFNTLTNLFFSKDLLAYEDDGVSANLKKVIYEMMKLGATPNIADFYPMFSALDMQGLRGNFIQIMNKVFDILDVHIKERASIDCYDVKKKKKEQDFLDVCLANNFSMDQIRVLLFELLSAGTDTTTSTIEWSLAELIKNGETMEKLRQELREEVKQKRIGESQIPQLPYLQACVKETLRLHPPTPFLLPHRAIESCEIMKYKIPKDSSISINVWAIGRDPTIWEDPLTFKPERFLDSDVDFKGHSFELLPFGAGRRNCPGTLMAAKQIHLIVASLVASFDWRLPDGEVPAQMDMNEKFGITLQKEKPLLVVPKRMR